MAHHPEHLQGTDTKTVTIIPARLGSTRFPRKMLADKTGLPLIVHVWKNACKARIPDRVVVATDAQEIVSCIEAAGGQAVMTDSTHPNGTSRLAQATHLLGLADETVVVNVQGDEPEIDPEMIDLAVQTLRATGTAAATIASPFGPDQDPADPNIVKVVLDAQGRALYFSRSEIPCNRENEPGLVRPLKHVGLYAYSVGFVRRYVTLPATPLELTEKLEQLRILEHGYAIAAAVAQADHVGIDTQSQYEAFVERYQKSTPAES